jgi:release factor glutamine methyltransferase
MKPDLSWLEAGVSIGEARRTLARAFAAASLDAPEVDARVLIGHALGLDHAALLSRAEEPLEPDVRAHVAGLAERRLAGEPVSRIIGRKEFWSLPFLVTPAVLVPRPETETVVETALAVLDAEDRRSAPLRIADLGTGSGALLLALLHELPEASGIGTDRSAAALAVAAENAKLLGLAARARFAACDFGQALAGAFDLVVSNPPYVATGEIAGLAWEVRAHDPPLALDGGPDGLAAYRAIAADAHRLLAPDGHLVLELGAGLERPVSSLISGAGLAPAGPAHPDLLGIARALHVARAGAHHHLHGSRQKTLGMSGKTQ